MKNSNLLWTSVRDHKHAFFQDDTPLWRVSVPPATPVIDMPGTGSDISAAWLIEWGGAQRWLKTSMPSDELREVVTAKKGHAVLFRGGNRQGRVFQPLSSPLMALHQRLKAEFDPHGILNPGRMYSDW